MSKLVDPTGIQDRCFWMPGGRPLLIEFKDPKGKLTELQSYYQKEMDHAGYRTEVVTDQTQFLEAIRCALNSDTERNEESTKRPSKGKR